MIQKKIFFLPVIFIVALLMTSCSVKELDKMPEDDSVKSKNHTVIVFMPWSSNLLPYFQQNINDIARAVKEQKIQDSRIIIVQSVSTSETEMTELYYSGNICQRKKLLTYQHANFTKQETIAAMLSDIKRLSPTACYSLIISSHGMGWLPVAATSVTSKNNMRAASMHYENTEAPLTRWFGGITLEYQIETTTLAQAIRTADMYMNYILFDNCYMSAVEVTYDLKDVTDYIVASPTEILIYGFPYYHCMQYLTGEADYYSLCDAFLDFYNAYQYPSGTIAVTDCREITNLAAIYRKICRKYSLENEKQNSIQIMDGYSPNIFYDFGDYVTKICKNETLLKDFERQMNKTIIYKGHTPKFYSSVSKEYYTISSFSGLTTSAPSRSEYMQYYQSTAWYQATH